MQLSQIILTKISLSLHKNGLVPPQLELDSILIKGIFLVHLTVNLRKMQNRF